MPLPPITPERLKEFYVSRLSKTLAEYGIDTEPEMFVDQLVELFQGLYPAFTIDELLVRPREALKFCDAVRTSCRNYDLPDDLLLRPLLNRRKHGYARPRKSKPLDCYAARSIEISLFGSAACTLKPFV